MEDIEHSVDRLNASLGANPLPVDSLRAIAASADPNVTLRDSTGADERLPSDKEDRYKMFTRLASAFWTAVQNVPVTVNGKEIKAGDSIRHLTGRIDDHGEHDLGEIWTAVSGGYSREMKQTLDETSATAADTDALRYNVSRILSGSQEGYQIVMNMVRSLLQSRAASAPTPLSPADFEKNIDRLGSQLKKIMKLNIIADEFLDALMYGNMNLFVCTERPDQPNEYEFAFKPELVTMMEEIGSRLCLDLEGQPIDMGAIIEEIHAIMEKHVGHENLQTDSHTIGDIYHHNVERIAGQLRERDGVEPHPITVLQEIEHGLFRDMNAKPLSQWHPIMREFCMTALLLKSVISWHSEPNVRNVSGCPMLYSKQFLPWLKKGSEPIKAWYAQAIESQSQP